MPAPRLPLALGLALLVAASAPAAPRRTLRGSPDTCPFAGHNAYPYKGQGADKLERALAAGLKHIEVDVTYDERRGMVVVTHDKKPSGGEPDLVRFVEPVWRTWADAPGRGYTLIIELKSPDPRIGRDLSALFRAHAGLLSRMSRGPAREFEPGKITVCLTGNEDGKQAYARQLAPSEPYLAFADRAWGPLDWKWNPAGYVPEGPPGFRRFVTCAVQNFTRLPFKSEVGVEAISERRLATVAELAAVRGYALRVYTVNAADSDGTVDTRLWKRLAAGHVPMIATDDYQLASDWWRAR